MTSRPTQFRDKITHGEKQTNNNVYLAKR